MASSDSSAAVPGYSFAFQPIVHIDSGKITAYEALLRGHNNESAFRVLAGMQGADFHEKDQIGRLAAIRLAARLALNCGLNLNIGPGALEHSSQRLTAIHEVARSCGIAAAQLTLEVTEHDIIDDHRRLIERLNEHRKLGGKVAIDDFGAGYAGLNLLADFQADVVKIDIGLVRDIDRRGPRQAIIRGVLRTCLDLGIDVIAEGVESEGEYWWFHDEGVSYFQGYLFGKAAYEQLPLAFYPD